MRTFLSLQVFLFFILLAYQKMENKMGFTILDLMEKWCNMVTDVECE